MKSQKFFINKILNIFIIIFRPIFKLIWIKKIKGVKNLPSKGPFIIAANHQSYFDFLSLSILFKFRPIFLAAEKFWDSKLWRPLMNITGQIKVERKAKDKSKAINQAINVLKDGKVLGIFPQGTRSRSGEIEKTYTGVAKIAFASGVPIIPIGIRGAYKIMPPQANRPKIKKILEIHIGKPIDPSIYKKYQKTKNPERELTNDLMEKIALLSNKNYKRE